MKIVSQLWNQIETWGFRKDIKGIDDDNVEEDNDNNKDKNDGKGISALGLDGDLEFSRGHQRQQGHQPHGDDNKENDNKMVDNNKDNNSNNKNEDDNEEDNDNSKNDYDDKGIPALRLDSVLCLT